MNSETLSSAAEIFRAIQKESEGKFGIICLNCLIVRSRFKEIFKFMERNNIPAPEDATLTKLELLDYISIDLFRRFQHNPQLQKKYKTPLTYIGNLIVNDEKLCDSNAKN
jgi:hypothetical protein